MSQATDQLSEKQHYHELTEKQRGIIDAYAQKPEGSHTAILRLANASLKEQDLSVTRAYVPVVLNKYRHIAEERKLMEHNNRPEGEEVVVGKTQIPPVEGDREIRISLTPDEVQSMAEERLPESIRLKLIRPLLEKKQKAE